MRIDGRKVLVTGGTTGIGQALVEKFLDLDCEVLSCARHAPVRPPALPRLHFLACDLATPTGRAQLVAEVQARHPDLSIVINNAGVQHLVDFPTTPVPQIELTSQDEIALNFQAPLLLCAALLPLLQRQNSAAFVNITTGLALAPKKSSPVYCATKAALRSFTRSFRYQVESVSPQVRVVEALPPLVATRMTAGRGSGKIAPADVADAIVAGLEADEDEIYIGKTRLLKVMARVAPSVVYRVLKTW
ncbi:SDR family oxidoreductase [Derxia lacustris]|uniref:SDR family oxidoreductase n=1 Tax=Derxia lacustris TaxID=764842 RepID=UPI000A170411|nr:SDR family NAD(P)-dependent oxidoreductase [Derxia lacustris]